MKNVVVVLVFLLREEGRGGEERGGEGRGGEGEIQEEGGGGIWNEWGSHPRVSAADL